MSNLGDGATIGNNWSTEGLVAAYPLVIPDNSDPLEYFSDPNKDQQYYNDLLSNNDRLEAYIAQLSTGDILNITNNLALKLGNTLSDVLRALVLNPSLRPITREGYAKLLRSSGTSLKVASWDMNFFIKMRGIFIAGNDDKLTLEQGLQAYLLFHDAIMRAYASVGLTAYYLELLRNASSDPDERKQAAAFLFKVYVRLRAEGYPHNMLYA